MNPVLRYAAPLVLASLVLSLSGCKSESTEESAAETAADATVAAPGAPIIPGVEGLATDRDQISYVIGRDIGGSLAVLKDEIDIEVLTKAIKDAMDGAEPLLTDEQQQEITVVLAERMQARQAAEKAAKAEAAKAEGEAFLASNKDKPGVQVTESGLQYRIERAGNGASPSATDVVRVHYRGTLLNGEVFDSSYDRGEPIEFNLGQVIPGWIEGLQLMKVGSKHTLWIPSELAYGEEGGGPIPGNSMLTFEVELLDVVK